LNVSTRFDLAGVSSA